jgi:hypothetical protein
VLGLVLYQAPTALGYGTFRSAQEEPVIGSPYAEIFLTSNLDGSVDPLIIANSMNPWVVHQGVTRRRNDLFPYGGSFNIQSGSLENALTPSWQGLSRHNAG